MVSFNKNTTHRVSGLRKFAIVAVLLSIAPTARMAPAQDHYYGSSTTSLESSLSWPWWHSIYFHANGSPRYSGGLSNSTRGTQNRLPVNPPICGPSYGYHQSCWKQMPVVRRCVSCETFPANREIPNSNSTQAPTQIPQVPPAPEDTEAKEKAEATDDKEAGSPEPDAPELIPAP